MLGSLVRAAGSMLTAPVRGGGGANSSSTCRARAERWISWRSRHICWSTLFGTHGSCAPSLSTTRPASPSRRWAPLLLVSCLFSKVGQYEYVA
eukprot:1175459-Prorocentrum_minimum.AAC.1